jgi:SAM-dependent methyltransferase
VDRIPDDPAARQAWLQQWAAEQEARVSRPRRRPVHDLRVKLAIALETQAERLDEYLDRGLDTAPPVYSIPETAATDGVIYKVTPFHVLPRALRAVDAGEDDVFADFGCGKGRIVHQAAKRPLKKVIGVDISPELVEFARRLVAEHQHEYRCKDVEIVLANGGEFAIPDDLTIAFLADPFRDKTFAEFLAHLVASLDRRPRRLRMIYLHPSGGAQVLATGRFRLVQWLRGGLRDSRITRTAIFEAIT